VRTYSELFALPGFRALFVNRLLVISSISMSGLALGTIVYDSTGSTFLTALAMFGGPLITLFGSVTVLGASDTVGPRAAMTGMCLVAAVVTALQMAPALPWPVRFLLLAIPYAVNSAFGGTVIRLLRGIVDDDSFVLGRATLNIAVGLMQVVGYALGGTLLQWFSASVLFGIASGLALLAAAAARLRLTEQPATQSRKRLVGRTHEVNRALLGSRVTRPLFLAAWVPHGLVVGCEALFVPYAGPAVAGYLFAATAAGMLLGDVVIGRFTPTRTRDRLIVPLRFLLALPFLGFLLGPPVPIALALAFVASMGYAAALPLQDRLVRTTDAAVSGQVFGLLGNGVMTGQALGAMLGGLVATWFGPSLTMGAMAALSAAVSLALVLPLRRSATGSTPVAS